jgi:hypothetical protein
VNRAAFPHDSRGLLEAGLELAGARQAHVRLLRSGAEATPPEPSSFVGRRALQPRSSEAPCAWARRASLDWRREGTGRRHVWATL